jgi:hypothetical protein
MPFKSSPAVRTVFLEQSRSQADNPPFIAWTLNAEFGVLSSLPPGRRDWPISHQDRIRLVYNRVLDAAQKLLSSLNMSFRAPALTLVISPQPVINAFAKPDGTVQINLALSELISDSPSELAFCSGPRAWAHCPVQQRRGFHLKTGRGRVGTIFCLFAGFDAYTSAGTLAKLNMALGQAGICTVLKTSKWTRSSTKCSSSARCRRLPRPARLTSRSFTRTCPLGAHAETRTGTGRPPAEPRARARPGEILVALALHLERRW